MIFKVAALTTLVASVAADIVPGTKFAANSKAGSKLLSKARALNEDRDVTWVANYDIKYTGCSGLVQIREEGGDDGLLYTQNLVKFSLCPSDDGCGKCENGAEYIVSMNEFLATYTEFKQQEQEAICENIEENCYCDNANDDQACANQCFIDAGQEDCIEYDGQEKFEIGDYLECAEMQAANDNNNNNNNYNYNNNNGDNWYGDYFVGPYCSESDGFSIKLGVFYDQGCSSRASTSAYASRNYGAELPFSSESIIKSECISCMQVDEDNNNNNNNNQNNNYYYNQELEVNELCGGVYEMAAKCEKTLENVQYRDTDGCEFIQKILPRLDSATRSKSKGRASRTSGEGGGSSAVAMAWIFAVTTLAFGGYAFFLYRKLTRNNVSLAGSDGALA